MKDEEFYDMKYHYLYEGNYIDEIVCTFDEQPIAWYLDSHYISITTAQTVPSEFYDWAITQGNLVKQTT